LQGETTARLYILATDPNLNKIESSMSLHPEQIKIFKSLSPEAKLKIAGKLYSSAKILKASAIRQQHPHWSEEKVAQKVREIFLNARS
jgi:hypothetical protein